ncbi:MAG: thioredoxin domain-containing protein [Candidatus Paceibacterota bacterium]|jgi:protein-disulfide isomerase
MEDKNYTLWGGVTLGVVVIVLGIMWFVGNTPAPKPGGNIVAPPVTEADWQEGASTLPLTLVEYSDFQCPACGAYYPVVQKLKAEYATSTRFVYRHFPLPQHLDAKYGAYAAEAAGKQGKFFEMHDMLFEKQTEWGIDTKVLLGDPEELTPAMEAVLMPKLLSYAQKLGLDIDKFKADIVSKEIKDKIDTAIADGRTLDIPATPTFFLNGKQLEPNPNGFDEFKKLIDAALPKS